MRFNKAFTEIIKQDLEQGIVPALMGQPGIGKSAFIENLAFEMNTKAFIVPCNQLADKSDLTGARLVPTADGKSYSQVFYPHHVIHEAIDYALANPRENPILDLSEINRTTSDVTSGALTIVTLRKLGHMELPKNLRIIVDGNDEGNVTALDEASLSRFAIYHVEPDAHTLIEILGDTMNPWVKQVLLKAPKLVFQKPNLDVLTSDGDDDDDTTTLDSVFHTGEEMNQITTPRTIENLSKWLNKVTRLQLQEYLETPTQVKGIDSSLLQEIIEAKVGRTDFAIQTLAVITEDLAQGIANATGTGGITVPEPTCYASLKAAKTIAELEDLIEELTDNEKGGSLVMALSQREDNEILIQKLTARIDKFDQGHTTTLFALVGQQQLDNNNLKAFVESDAPLARTLGPALSGFVN